MNGTEGKAFAKYKVIYYIGNAIFTVMLKFTIITLWESHRGYCIEKSKLIEKGSHEELMNLGGYYSYLYDLQNDVIIT